MSSLQALKEVKDSQLFLISSTWPTVPCKSKVSQSNERWQSASLQTNKSCSEMPHQLTECLSKQIQVWDKYEGAVGFKTTRAGSVIHHYFQRSLPFPFSELFMNYHPGTEWSCFSWCFLSSSSSKNLKTSSLPLNLWPEQHNAYFYVLNSSLCF